MASVKKKKNQTQKIQLVNIILFISKNSVQYMKTQQETEILAFPYVHILNTLPFVFFMRMLKET